MIVPAITLYAVLVWFLWGFFMALGWVLGTWIMGQVVSLKWRDRAAAGFNWRRFS